MITIKLNKNNRSITVKKTSRNVQLIRVGRQGPTGADGPTGATGPPGPQGEPGEPGVVQSIVAGDNITVDDTDPANPIVSAAAGGGAVDSVNGQTGVVVLDTDDIADTATNRYTNDSDITRLANTSGTNTGDQDLSGYVPTTRTVNGHALSANVTVTKSDVGLSNVDNTSDANKPVSTATQTALNLKANDADVIHDTGDETVAGIKTFSSDPLIPDESYGSGWNGSLEPPTKNAIYDKIESIVDSGISRIVTITSGSFTAGSASETDYVYLLAGAHVPTMPTAVSNTNRYTFKNNHSANITFLTTGGQTIDGGTLVLGPEEAVDLISNNSNWNII